MVLQYTLHLQQPHLSSWYGVTPWHCASWVLRAQVGLSLLKHMHLPGYESDTTVAHDGFVSSGSMLHAPCKV